MSKHIFVAADYINLEGRLVAHFSGDTRLKEMFAEELKGGHKVHAQTAALLYNIDPADAKTYMTMLQGNEVPAYAGGKRCRHLWGYGGKARKMSQTFWISLDRAQEIDDILTAAHPAIPLWWDSLANEVFGVSNYVCPRCEYTDTVMGACPECKTKPIPVPPTLRWNGWEQEPTNVLYTPFGRRRFYLGRRKDSLNALISQRPQSCGASQWYRTLMRLHGIDPSGQRWEAPDAIDVLCYNGWYDRLAMKHNGASAVTGTYDSFVLRCLAEHKDIVIQWLAWTMEQPWRELGGERFPVEVCVGNNWGEENESNPDGLKKVEYKPLSATRP